jgi:hypothetical protein
MIIAELNIISEYNNYSRALIRYYVDMIIPAMMLFQLNGLTYCFGHLRKSE